MDGQHKHQHQGQGTRQRDGGKLDVLNRYHRQLLTAKLRIIARKNKEMAFFFCRKGRFQPILCRKSPIPSGTHPSVVRVQIGENYTPNCRFLHTIVDFCTPYIIYFAYLCTVKENERSTIDLDH
jgi:hypothetical protein